ncbi:MAG: pyridoxamine 5'-phosphate oxidase family protein [Coriobacteriales bacterium]|jgi:uncharacterized pyridoxamine 5'-phosphate oxidase family protein|nr:pyridoxamine 5'-phosphate oxidase family protein [Coriobacteriales bacterium]
MKEALEFLKKAGTYYIATVEGDQPRVRPFGTAHIYDGKLYIQTGKSKDVSKQLETNPKAEICAFVDGNWLRIAATLVNDDSIKAQESMLEDYPELRNMYQAGDGNTQVLYLKDATASYYSFTSEPPMTPRVVKF